jgi:hypothetical protein
VKCPAKEPAPLRNPTVKGIMASRVPVGAV